MEKIKALQNTDKLCWKCLNESEKIITMKFGPLGYGSNFDCCSTKIQLCDACYKESKPEIWSEKLVYDSEIEKENDWSHYEHEDEMFEYFGTLPIEGKQFVWNEFWQGDYYMEPQDWIDYELGILPHEKAKEYGMYSIQEIQAYEERFPKCKHPVNVLYNDGSKGCWCPFGAYGDYNQGINVNVSNECYQCPYYKERRDDEKIVEIQNEHFNDYKILKRAEAIKTQNKGLIELLLFTNYGSSSIPDELMEAAKENPESMIRHRSGAVVKKLKEIAYEIDGLDGMTEAKLKSLIIKNGVIHAKKEGIYLYMKKGDGYFTTMGIVQVDTGRKWILHDYDGAESILYVEDVDEAIGLCRLT